MRIKIGKVDKSTVVTACIVFVIALLAAILEKVLG